MPRSAGAWRQHVARAHGLLHLAGHLPCPACWLSRPCLTAPRKSSTAVPPLQKLTFLRMGDMMIDNWSAFGAFLQRLTCPP